MGNEGRPLPQHALDRQPPAMAIEDVLDQCKTQAGAALRAALGDIDAVEALGQPRQVLRRDAGTMIAHRDARLLLAARPLAERELDVDALAGGGIFQRVLHQILEHADQLVAVAQHQQRARGRGGVDLDVAVAGQGLQAVGDLADDGDEIDLLVGPQMRVELDAREREQIVDQARHAVRLHLHDGEEALARRGILARRALQRVDEARQRGERGAKLMAGIGDEVGTHLLDATQRREIVKREQHEARPGRGLRRRDRRHHRFVPAVDRHALEELRALRAPRSRARGGSRPGPPARAARATPARRGEALARSRSPAH